MGHTMVQDIKVESTTATAAVGLGGLTAYTLNEWVAIFTIGFITVQAVFLFRKWYLMEVDRKKNDESKK